MSVRRTVLCALAAAALSVAGLAHAQEDTMPIKMLVGFAPGGPGDFTVRLLAEKMSASLGRSVVVQSVPGAGSQVALGQLKRAAPDGRTLMFVSNSLFTIYPQIYSIDYDPVKDFTPIASVAKFDNAIATGPATGATSLPQLVAWMKAHKDSVSFGTPGAGSLPHILGTKLSNEIGVPMVHVPYKNASASVVDLVGGRVPILITSADLMMEMHRSGKIRILAVSSDERQPTLPDVPTLKEMGYDVSMVITNGVFGPAGMDPKLVAHFNKAIVDAVNSPDMQQKLREHGIFPAPSSPGEFADALVTEYKRLAPTIATMGPISQ
jgi:tripartite-type tricarboxylate transporter receptor subunit TctC